ncbi:hypothetical protein CALCODRAFT_3233 [Calocera cornea HHB12733]|uniref:CDC14-domain-containing protein n=1 Tax=Calocera cornea HHB12733 TaxID=1353952 RepID=A0A165K9K1_9BASI|nr:hypothetical protein CALCODRAFT_3233 [Calocera cornea HHB12733]
MHTMHTTILQALDDVSSSRSSLTRRVRALTTLERVLAQLCKVPPTTPEGLDEFRRLQDAFDTNIATRLVTFLTLSLPQLEQLTLPSPSLSAPGTPSRSHSRSHSHSHSHHLSPTPDPASLSSAITQALTLMQGVCFLHPPSKAWLGRKAPLQVLLDLLLVSRPHPGLGASSLSSASASTSIADSRSPSSGYPGAPSPVPLSPLEAPSPAAPPPSPGGAATSLPLAVLDTLLVILVDSPRALRAFEDAQGLEAVVRTLKRAGVPRDVRMRCLEFLYFYLLPEADTGSPSPTPTPVLAQETGGGRRAQTPHELGQFLSTPAGPSRRASPLSRTSTSTPTPPTPVPDLHAIPALTTSRSSSASSASSFSSAPSPALLARRLPPAVERAKEELERFVPSTPKKGKLARIGMGTPRHPGSGDSSREGSMSVRSRRLPSVGERGEGAGQEDEGEEEGEREDTPTPQPHSQPPGPPGLQGPQPPVTQGVPALCLTTPSRSGSSPSLALAGGGVGGMRGLGLDLSVQGGLAVALAGLEDGRDAREVRDGRDETGREGRESREERMVRSTEEKRERLGAWLGNVDQLVDGVRRAGVWGLV